MTDGSDILLDLLDLRADGADVFVADTPDQGPSGPSEREAQRPGRLFGGQVASQSLRAATLTVPTERLPHSLHAYFVRPGRPGVPLVLQVDRTRDGRSFTTRRVEASQDGEPIFTMVASFHIEEGTPDDDWQQPAPAGIPGPDTLPPRRSSMAQWATMQAFDMRLVRQPNEGDWPVIHPFWIRHRDRLPDDPALHACVLTFLSDMAVVGSALAPGRRRMAHMGASLDHAVWFHRRARADEWVLFSVGPVSNAGYRGLALGSMHTEDGALIASVAQEALLRVARG